MTDRTEALDALIEAVAKEGDDLRVLELASPHGGNYVYIIDAYRGSLDAALRLHEALLPGVHWEIWSGVDGGYGCNLPRQDTAYCNTPARAMLLATLRAYRAKEGG